STGSFHEPNGSIDLGGKFIKPGIGGVRHETFIPGVHGTQICETTRGEGTKQVQRGSRRMVGLHHATWIVTTRLFGEIEAIDDLATEGWQLNAVTDFDIR